MKALGALPEAVPAVKILESIGENILIADTHFNIIWINPVASTLLAHAVPLYGLNSVEEVIGLNMSFFHKTPAHQQAIMDQLTSTHRARIHIKGKFVADIIVTPVMDEKVIKAYIVMLMDVTTTSEEEKRRDLQIKALSVPIMQIWDSTIAIPLLGGFDLDRGELLLSRVLENAVTNRIRHVLVDVSGLNDWNNETGAYIKKLGDTLRVIGAKCYIAGISPEAAISFLAFNFTFPTFTSIQSGLIHVMENDDKLKR